MDVTSRTFAFHLPRILTDLSTCCFVSIDFEFSGIPKSHGEPAKGSQTLQERYEETRRAADKYQILQIGLTICHEDTETASYTLKPYNLYLSPIVDKKLEVERDFSFQSSAVEFLLGAKFRMDSFFSDGVPYISREEERIAIEKAAARRDRVATRDALDVKETEHESLSFLGNVRYLVNNWLALGNAREPFLNIPPPSTNASKTSHSLPTVLNRFQKRLVHQLIEVEYPSLVTISKQDFIQIIDYDENREKAIRDQRYRLMQERIWRQTGFRWIAEALAGGDLSHLDPIYFRSLDSAAAKSNDSEVLSRLNQQIKSHRPVLVGHNLFMDLAFFCRCFFGPLPDKVEDFQAMAHGLFPTLMDTKYMATHDCGSINPVSSLTEINDNLARIAVPRIAVHPQHKKYNEQQVDHEAGYDSLLTAQVFIKLSSQLREGGSSKLPGVLSAPAPNIPPTIDIGYLPNLARVESSLPTNTYPTQMPPGSQKTTVAHRTKFDALEVEDSATTPNTACPDVVQKISRGELIPRMGTEFWRIYGNKLRVFGTKERVCTVGGQDRMTLPQS